MLRKPDGTRSVHTADGGAILDIESGRMYFLNPSASFIFQLLERGFSDGQIVDQLVERFAISTDQARGDLAAFCDALTNHSILPSG